MCVCVYVSYSKGALDWIFTYRQTEREHTERTERVLARARAEGGSVCVKNQPDSAPPGGGREGETKRESE